MKHKRQGPLTIPRPPDLTARVRAAGLPRAQLEDEECYEAFTLSHTSLAGQVAEAVSFTDAIFSHVDLDETRLTEPHLRDIRFEHCTFANAHWHKPVLARVACIACRLTGLTVIEGQFSDLLLQECQAPLASFRFGTFKGARFEHCAMAEVDFQGADLSGVQFVQCDLRGAQFSGATLTGADLRSSTIDGLQIGAAELRGAIVDPAQAVEIARLLGLTVAWSSE